MGAHGFYLKPCDDFKLFLLIAGDGSWQGGSCSWGIESKEGAEVVEMGSTE